MNILIYSNMEDDLGSLPFKYIVDYLEEYNFEAHENPQNLLQNYRKKEFDVVILDDEAPHFKKVLNTISNLKSFQNTIIVSSKVKPCNPLMDCDFCTKNYSRRRLFKPLDSFELIDTIKNIYEQNCKYFNTLKDKSTVLGDILKKFLYFTYNEKRDLIEPNPDTSTSLLMAELLEVIDLLDEHGLQYEVNHDHTISISQ